MLLTTILTTVSIFTAKSIVAADNNLCKSLNITEGGFVCTGERSFSQCSYGGLCDYPENCKATYKDSIGSSGSTDIPTVAQYVAPVAEVHPGYAANPTPVVSTTPAAVAPVATPPPSYQYSTPAPVPTAVSGGGYGQPSGGYVPPPAAQPVGYNPPAAQTPAPWMYQPTPVAGYAAPAESPVHIQNYIPYEPQPVQNYIPYGQEPVREYHSWRHHRHTPPCTTPRPVYMTHHRHHWKAPWTTKSRHHHYPSTTTTVPKPTKTAAAHGYKHKEHGYKKHVQKPFDGYPVNDPLAWGIDFPVPKNAAGGDLAAPNGRYMQPQKGEDRGIYGPYGPDDLQPVAGKVGHAIPSKGDGYGPDDDWTPPNGYDGYGSPAPAPKGYDMPDSYAAPAPKGYGDSAPAPKGYGSLAPASYAAPAPKGYGMQDSYAAPAPKGYGNQSPASYAGPKGYSDPAPAPKGYGSPAPASYAAPAPKGYGMQDSYSASAPKGYGNPAPASYAAPAPKGYSDPAPAPKGYGMQDSYAAPAPNGYGDSTPAPQGYGNSEPADYEDPTPEQYGGYVKPRPGYKSGGDKIPPAIKYKRPASSYNQNTDQTGYGGSVPAAAGYGQAPAAPGYGDKPAPPSYGSMPATSGYGKNPVAPGYGDKPANSYNQAPSAPVGYYGRGSK
ncbi:hypothetical protein HDU81_011347 [Chytriomyces hyalinus]|nr:hypothetical protein HDU81_011347 [Chytriomyces hyalinus]